jgi:hypothetical protein
MWLAGLMLGYFLSPPYALISLGIAGLFQLGGFIGMVVLAFQEGGPLHGILALFIGPYALVFACMHWDAGKRSFFAWLFGFILSTITQILLLTVLKQVEGT